MDYSGGKLQNRNRLNYLWANNKMKSPTPIVCFCFIFFLYCSPSPKNDNLFEADVIVYGGTSAGVMAAVEVVQSGKTVILVTPETHLGGLTASGLGWTDTGKKEVIGGLSRNFYHRIWQYYNQDQAWVWQKKEEYGGRGQGTPAIDGSKRTMWIFEPHVAEKVYEDYIAEYKINTFREEWLDRASGVRKKNGKIVSMTTLSGKTFKGKIFIDATYEGDLMASADVSYHVGRESSKTYDEKWNGVQTGVLHHQHWFWENISPYKIAGDPSSGLLPRISPLPPGEFGTADNKIQAYCFRLCMTNHPENKVPFSKPKNYDASQYSLLLRSLQTGRKDFFRKFDPIPNLKTDTNNHGPFSSDNIGMNYDYPEASYERRKEIIEEHKNYQMGLLYFVSNDPRVPADIREKLAQWGLAKDEFVDNGNWPHQIYVREARRMIGAYVTTEQDVLLKREVPKPIGMGSYAMDSHNVQRYVTPEGYVQNEGDIGVKPPAPYSISYGSLTPKKEECTNLLVPVCLSSSHIAFGSIRMEPVFMILGQSAAVAACLAIEKDSSVQDIDYVELEQLLRNKGQILTLEQVKMN